jgi:hypothetical protein
MNEWRTHAEDNYMIVTTLHLGAVPLLRAKPSLFDCLPEKRPVTPSGP